MEATSAALSVLSPSITGMTSLSSYNDINDRRVTFTSTEDAEIKVLFYIEVLGDLFFLYTFRCKRLSKILMLHIWAIFFMKIQIHMKVQVKSMKGIFSN